MSSRVTRRVMEMTDNELSAVLAVAMPKTKFDGIAREQRQESVLKCMNHEFMLDIEDDDIYVLMRNKPCTCCTKTPEPPVSYKKETDGVTLPPLTEKEKSAGEPPTIPNGLLTPKSDASKNSSGSVSFGSKSNAFQDLAKLDFGRETRPESSADYHPTKTDGSFKFNKETTA